MEVRDEEIETFLPAIYDELKDLTKEELIKKVVSEEFNSFHDYYLNAPDLNISNGVDGAFGKHRTSRFFLNMGRLDGFNLHSMRDFLCDLTKLHPRMVFNIDIKNSFSFFEITFNNALNVLYFRLVLWSNNRNGDTRFTRVLS